MSPSITIQLARTRAEFESAFRLLQRSREHWKWDSEGDPQKLWLLKQHALPTTNTIVALQGSKVIGAICLFGESPLKLPIESHRDLAPVREKTEGRLAEVSLPGLHADFADDQDLIYSLCHFAACFGADYCNYEFFTMETPLELSEALVKSMHFEKISAPKDGRQLLFLNVREGVDFHAHSTPRLVPECKFPEKKFFHVAHQRMPVDVLNSLFNERTSLFSDLSDFELRVLRNIYDYGEYAQVLPKRNSGPERKAPRFPRFPMNCEGYLVSDDGDRLNVQLLDVSREGLKLCCPEGIDTEHTYMLTLFVGVNRKTELIAQIVWVDEPSGIAGFLIKSHDQNWTQLLEYLEKDYNKSA